MIALACGGCPYGHRPDAGCARPERQTALSLPNEPSALLRLESAELKAGYLQMTDSPSGVGTGRRRIRQASQLFCRLGRNPRRPRIRPGFGAAPGPKILSIGKFGILEPPQNMQCAESSSRARTAAVKRCRSGVWEAPYGAAFISNQWYPDRLNTVRHGLTGGSYRLGFDVARNMAKEFWPDIRSRISRRKP